MTVTHAPAEGHRHTHGPDCGHTGVIHFDHVDYLHDGHAHREHLDPDGTLHYDECDSCTCGCGKPCAVCDRTVCSCETCTHTACECASCDDTCANCTCKDCTCSTCQHAA